jgi:hypothetical protein
MLPSENLVAAPGAGDAAPHIDWAQQAETVAADSAKIDSAPEIPGRSGKSPFTPPPTHHSGDEFVTTSGDRAVFINDHCYQVSKVFSDAPNGISNGMGLQTYCIRPSNKARGDLFDQLSAYKKLHPDH